MVFIYELDGNGVYKKPVTGKQNEVIASLSVPGVEVDFNTVF